jgi:NAD(P)-dependent dehydrogenase (short-subunit alcohol dehydrogenase family)
MQGSARSLRSLGDLAGRGALVAGGAGHIGRAAVEALVELGAKVAVCDVAEPEGNAVWLRCDLSSEAESRAVVREAIARLGGLDILVHCAALVGQTTLAGWSVPLGEQTVEAWDGALRVNLTSAFVLVQEAHEALAASGRGSVILFGSTYGMVGPDSSLYEGTEMANPTAYGASKGGVLQLTRYLATQLAPEVRVNAISPGGIARGQPEAFQDRYRERTPLRRMATEEDVKGAVAYLASDLSAYVTGHNLVVDGGWTAW